MPDRLKLIICEGDYFLVKIFLPAQLIVLVLVVRALGVAVTLQVWVDAGVRPGAVEELFT